MSDLVHFFQSGGFVMYPLLACSLFAWGVIFERAWRYRSLKRDLRAFYLEALNSLLREDHSNLEKLCFQYRDLPTARLVSLATDRLKSKDSNVRSQWAQAVERQRLLEGQELRKGFWILGTIGSAAPFIGLFGTVVGILRSFRDIAETGKGGFAVVASGISEALIATASGIVVAVVAVMAFNAFQAYWSQLVLTIKIQTEEFLEIIAAVGTTGHVKPKDK